MTVRDLAAMRQVLLSTNRSPHYILTDYFQSSDSTNNFTDATVRDLAAMRQVLLFPNRSPHNILTDYFQILDSANKLTDATVRDLAAMRQVLLFPNRLPHYILTDYFQSSYLTMIFLLASFIAVSRVLLCEAMVVSRIWPHLFPSLSSGSMRKISTAQVL